MTFRKPLSPPRVPSFLPLCEYSPVDSHLVPKKPVLHCAVCGGALFTLWRERVNEWMKKYSPYLYICVSTLLYCQKMWNSLSQICLSLLNFLWPLNVILQYYFRDRYQSNLFYNDGCNLTGHSKRHLLVRTIELRC